MYYTKQCSENTDFWYFPVWYHGGSVSVLSEVFLFYLIILSQILFYVAVYFCRCTTYASLITDNTEGIQYWISYLKINVSNC